MCVAADALRCHQCTSQTDTECGDPMWFEPEKEGGKRVLKTDKFLNECPTDKEYTICRKMYQNGKRTLPLAEQPIWHRH
jgi:hypothetical protein